MATPKIIYHIVGPITGVGTTQFGVQLDVDPVTGYRMWGGKDAVNGETKWLALDKNARLANLEMLGTLKSKTMTYKPGVSLSPVERTFAWDEDENSPFFYNSVDNHRNIIGKIVLIPKAYNDTGTAITRGSACRVLGADTGRPSIELVGALNYQTDDIIAFPVRDIQDGGEGDLLWIGALPDFNTGSFLAWSKLYLSDTPGQISDAPGTNEVYVGRCLAQSAATGRVLFVGTGFGAISTITSDVTLSGTGTTGDPLKVTGQSRVRTVSVSSGTVLATDMIIQIDLETIDDNCNVLVPAGILSTNGFGFSIERIGADTGYEIRVYETAVSGDPDYTIFGNEDRDNDFRISNGLLVGKGFNI